MLLIFSEQTDLLLWFQLPAFHSWYGQTLISSLPPKLQIYIFGSLFVIPPSEKFILVITKWSSYFSSKPPFCVINMPCFREMHCHLSRYPKEKIKSPCKFPLLCLQHQWTLYISLIKMWTYLSSVSLLQAHCHFFNSNLTISHLDCLTFYGSILLYVLYKKTILHKCYRGKKAIHVKVQLEKIKKCHLNI